MLTAKPVAIVAYQWKGDEPGKDWPTWFLAAAEEYRRAGHAGWPAWPFATVSVTNQNMPCVKMAVTRPLSESLLWARPGDWIVRTDANHWDVYTDEIYKATFGED